MACSRCQALTQMPIHNARRSPLAYLKRRRPSGSIRVFAILAFAGVVTLCGFGDFRAGNSAGSAQSQYPFQNPDLPIDERVKNILSLMTLDEKIACLGTDPSVPRLGIKASGHVEGIHGSAQAALAKWVGLQHGSYYDFSKELDWGKPGILIYAPRR